MSGSKRRSGPRVRLGGPLSGALLATLLAWPGLGRAHDIELELSPAVSPDPSDPEAVLVLEQVDLGNARDSAGARPSVTPVRLSRAVDFASAKLFHQSLLPNTNVDATVRVYEPDPLSPGERRLVEEYFFDEVIFVRWAVELVAGFGLVETVELDWLRMEWCQWSYGAEVAEPTETCRGFDRELGTAWARP